VSVGGRVRELVESEPRMLGFIVLSVSSLVLGWLITLAAQLREREARARALSLQLELQRSQAEKQAVDARLALLQGQIEPHFLFNTLANVQALVETGSPHAAEVLKSLIAYLRAAMPRLHDQQPTLGSELALVRSYLELMRMRLPDRLSYTLRVDPGLHDLPLPTMALLTLVENAVRHGIDPAEDGGAIDVGAERSGEVTRVWVADSGAGMAEHAQPGTGLPNLRARLAGFYDGKAELVLSEAQPSGLRAEIVIKS
jgi:LytS/YehU family sensor histidine kinase